MGFHSAIDVISVMQGSCSYFSVTYRLGIKIIFRFLRHILGVRQGTGTCERHSIRIPKTQQSRRT